MGRGVKRARVVPVSAPAGRGGRPRKAQKAGLQPFQPTQCEDAPVLKGGCLRTPVFLPTVRFEGEDFVKLHIREPWLCQAVAGKSHGLDPLRRTSCIQDLRAAVVGAYETVDAEPPALAESPAPAETPSIESKAAGISGMAGFGLDADQASLQPAAPSQAPSRQLGKTSPRNRKKPARAPVVPTRLDVAVPSGVQGPGGPRRESFRALTRAPGARGTTKGIVWVGKGELHWILATLRRELDDGGVSFQPGSSRVSMYFSLRDSAWCARAKDPLGAPQRKQFPVQRFGLTQDGRRKPLSATEFQKQKEEIREEAREWIASISGQTD